jgi:D-sedoheptulose 7-phosphate isomerase
MRTSSSSRAAVPPAGVFRPTITGHIPGVTTTDDVRTAAALDPAERVLDEHVQRLAAALPALRAAVPQLTRWGARLAQRLGSGARLLVAGNGGSAAEAQHLTAELVGRFDRERRPVSALALHAETSSITAIGNDYGYAEVYARQVRAHARAGDVVLLLSTSGRSPNLLAAAHAAAACGAEAWALTGPGPNPLARRCAEAVCLPGDTATVQESQLVAVHMVCRAFEEAFAAGDDREPWA